MKKIIMASLFLCVFQVACAAGIDRTVFPKNDMQKLQQRYETKVYGERWMPLHIVQEAFEAACLGDQRARAFLVTIFMVKPVADTHYMRGSLEEQAQKVEIGFKVALGYKDLGILNEVQILRDRSLEELETENPFIVKKLLSIKAEFK